MAKWIFLTNQMNLSYMLGTGLLMPPAEFGGKYYKDLLELYPGWVPLYPDRPSQEAYNYVMKENKNLLTPCYFEVDLLNIRGTGWSLVDSIWQRVEDLQKLPEKCEVLLLPAPLPLGLMKKNTIYFYDKEKIESYKQSLSDFSNVLSQHLTFSSRTRKPRKNKKEAFISPDSQGIYGEPKEREVNLTSIQKKGGGMAALALLGGQNNLALSAYQKYSDKSNENSSSTLWDFLVSFLKNSQIPEELKGSRDENYLKLAKAIINDTKENANKDNRLMAVFTELERIIEHYRSEDNAKAAEMANQLLLTLKEEVQFPQDTKNDLLERFSNFLFQVLISLVKTDGFVDYLNSSLSKVHKDSKKEEVEAATIFLLGLGIGWSYLDKTYKIQHELYKFIPMFMAQLAHHESDENRLNFDSIERPKLLSEYFTVSKNEKNETKAWVRSVKDAAIKLSRDKGWENDCIFTELRLPEEKEKSHIFARGKYAYLRLHGDIEVKSDINQEKFLEFFKEAQKEGLNIDLESNIRKILRG